MTRTGHVAATAAGVDALIVKKGASLCSGYFSSFEITRSKAQVGAAPCFRLSLFYWKKVDRGEAEGLFHIQLMLSRSQALPPGGEFRIGLNTHLGNIQTGVFIGLMNPNANCFVDGDPDRAARCRDKNATRANAD